MSLPNPIVLLDARAKYVHPAFQMTRASTKTVFDSTGKLVTVPANALGWDHDPATGQALGYLSEPEATNLLTYSQDGSQQTAKGEAVIEADVATAPDGTQTAFLLREGSSAGPMFYDHTPSALTWGTDDVILCGQVFVKAAGHTTVTLRPGRSPSDYARFDITTGDVLSQGGNVLDAGAQPLWNDWWWLYTVTQPGNTTQNQYLRVDLLDYNESLPGDNTSGVYLWGAQMREGDFPTGYIPTEGSAATRLGDTLSIPTSAFPYNPNEGTILVEASGDMVDEGILLKISNSLTSAVGAHIAWNRTNGRYEAVVRSANFSDAKIPATSGSRAVIALAHRTGEQISFAHNGVLASSSVDADWDGSAQSVFVGNGAVSGGGRDARQPNAPIYRVAYYPQRLSNADLQSLTAVQE